MNLHNDVLTMSGLTSGGTLALSVRYGDKIVARQTLTREETAAQPTVNMSVDATRYYTLALSDPDAPAAKEKGKGNEWLHWLVVNIRGKDISTGRVIQAYQGPSPPAGSGTHRYIFTLLAQPDTISVSPTPAQVSFNFQQFANQYGLQEKQREQFTVDAE